MQTQNRCVQKKGLFPGVHVLVHGLSISGANNSKSVGKKARSKQENEVDTRLWQDKNNARTRTVRYNKLAQDNVNRVLIYCD